MAIYREDIVDIELESGSVFRSFLNHTIGAGDSYANRFGVRVFRNGEAEQINGTVSGYFIRADGETVLIEAGTVEGNRAYVELPASCYAVEGQFALAIKVTSGGNTTTMRIIDGTVSRTSTETAVDPGTVIPSIDALIAAIEAAEESLPEDYTDLSARVAYNAQQTLAERENTNEINLGAGISWSKNHIKTSGADEDNGYNLRTDDYIPIENPRGDGFTIITDGLPAALGVRVFYYDDTKQLISYDNSDNYSTGRTIEWYGIPAETRYVRLLFHDSNWGVLDGGAYSYASRIKLYITTGDDRPDVPGFTFFPHVTMKESNGDDRPNTNNTRVMTDLIPVGKGTVAKAPSDTEDSALAARMWVYEYNAEMEKTGESAAWGREWIFSQDCYARIILRKNQSDLDDEDVEEVEEYLTLDYRAPTAPGISADILAGRTVADPSALNGSDDIIHGQMWEYGFITVEGENSLNQGIIRMRNSVTVEKYASIVIDCTEFTNVVGRYLFYDRDGDVVSAVTINNMQGRSTVAVPAGAYSFRIAIAEGWDDAGAVLVSDGKKLRISGVMSADNGLPDYYSEPIETAVQNYIKKAETDRLGYIWISDIHLSTNHTDYSYGTFPKVIAAVRETAERANADFIVIGGDVVDAESSAENIYPMLVKAFKPLAGCRVPVIWLLGNHDDNAYGTAITKALAINIFPGNSQFYNDIVPQENGYFYFDIPAKHKRVVCLNAQEYPSGKNGSNWWSLSQAEMQWFCETALDTEYDIVILSHMCPVYDYNFYGLGDEGGYHTDLIDAIEAYNSKDSITLYGQTYNFSRQTTNSIKVMHVGHWHWENNPDYLDIQAGGVECIITGCAKQWSQALKEGEEEVDEDDCVYTFSAATGEDWGANSSGYEYTHWHDRTAGTIKEALFDLVTVNSSTVNCYRIGAGKDRAFDL